MLPLPLPHTLAETLALLSPHEHEPPPQHPPLACSRSWMGAGVACVADGVEVVFVLMPLPLNSFRSALAAESL